MLTINNERINKEYLVERNFEKDDGRYWTSRYGRDDEDIWGRRNR